MFRTIVWATDGSEFADRALLQARSSRMSTTRR